MTDHHRQNDVTAPRWPAPGTTFGPDAASLGALREVLRAWPRRGEWVWADGEQSSPGPDRGYIAANVEDGEVWTLVRDTQPAEPEPARTVVVSLGWTFWYDEPGATFAPFDSIRDAEEARSDAIANGIECGTVVEVRAALPLPVDPAVVVGTVVPVEVSDGEA